MGENKNERTLIQSGWEWYQRGWYREAIECFAEAAATNLDDAEAHLCLGCAYLARAEPERALLAFERAAHLDPTSADPYVAMARIYVGLGDTGPAIAALETACRVSGDKESAGHQIAIAGLAYFAGDMPKAETHFRTVLAECPDDAFLLCALAAVLLPQNKNAEARDLLRRVAPLPFSAADDCYNLGVAEERLGNRQGAAAAYRRALDKDRNHDLARCALTRVEFRRFRWWSAGRHSVQAVRNLLTRRRRIRFAPLSGGERRQPAGVVAYSSAGAADHEA